MALSYAVLALDTAARLDRELAAITSYLEDPGGLFARDARVAFLLRSIETIVMRTRLLRQHVLDAVSCSSEPAIDIHERAIRGRANVIMGALNVLKRREHELPEVALVGRFQRVHDVSTFLVDQVADIYTRWKEQRETARYLDAGSQHALRYTAVDDAEIAFERLGRDPALATFLRRSVTSESEPIQIVCREIAVTVGLPLSTESGDRTDDAPNAREERAS